MHGYLALRTQEGRIIASGDLIQITRGDRVISHLVIRFRDGSIDDDTATFIQRDHLQLVSDHQIQKGPAFTSAEDVSIDVPICRVSIRYSENGKSKVETDHLDLPADLANGIVLNVLKNIQAEAGELDIPYLATTPKPRLIKLSILREGQDSFWIAGARQKAVRFLIKPQLGGLAGIVAPIFGKEPKDTKIWVAVDEVPAFIKLEGPLFQGGPAWTIEMTSPVWHQ